MAPDAEPKQPYRGRFAPSPSGPLHFGSLVAAVASLADARHQGGEWLVRIEDLDPLRTVAGAADRILHTLAALGLAWDGPILYQSGRAAVYEDALAELHRAGLTYPCACSRTEVATRARQGPEGPVYPGTCRGGLPPGRRPRALRIRVPEGSMTVIDRIQGAVHQDLAADVGDFVLLRADGVTAYQLAVVVDDAEQGITDVVRGADLTLSTPRQIYLQGLLGLPTPRYAHVPLVRDALGRKLSKSEASAPVEPATPLPPLLRAWAFLGQAPPSESPGTVDAFWSYAREAWDIARVPPQASSA